MIHQHSTFVKEIYPDMKVPNVFRNTAKPITLEELKKLDDLFINPDEAKPEV